jgi:hypothetical protein
VFEQALYVCHHNLLLNILAVLIYKLHIFDLEREEFVNLQHILLVILTKDYCYRGHCVNQLPSEKVGQTNTNPRL